MPIPLRHLWQFSSRHPSHRVGLRHTALLIGAMGLVLLAVAVLPMPEWVRGQAHYPPLHMLLETLAIVVAAMVFAISWASYRRIKADTLLSLACGFAGVAILDFSHMLSFQGMPDFVTPADPEKAITFWLAARGMAAGTLLWVALRPWKASGQRFERWAILGLSLLAVAVVHFTVFVHPHLLPRTFVSGQGLTTFKIGSEYLLIAVHLFTAFSFWRSMRTPQPFNIAALFCASLAMALGELCFTLYATVTDQFNLLGHLFKVIAYWLLYKGIFVEAIEQPYDQLAQSRAQLQATFDAIPDMLFELDEQERIINCHASTDTRLKIEPQQLVGKLIAELLSDDVLPLCRQTMQNASARGYAQSQPFVFEQAGQSLWLQLSVSARKIGGRPNGHVLLVRDVSQLKQQEERILHLAHFDPLTGLPNRTLFRQRVTLSLGVAQRHQQSVALLLIDLDHFKHINDTLGHSAGDQLLCAVAERLQPHLRAEDIVSRQGGDEFILALPDVDAAGAMHAARRILDDLLEPLHFAGHVTTPSASIGIALFPNDSDDLDSLLQHADAAMYLAKQRGRNNVQFYTADLQSRMSRLLELENALRTAIERNELSLYYQPQWALAGQRLLGFEVLLRWHHPVLGNVSPAEFIPVAESSGQIGEIGHWVLEQGVAQLARWRAAGFTAITLAINLSAVQFRRTDLASQIAALLTDAQVPPEKLELELTEGTAMEDPKQARQQLSSLHQLGVRLAIDDFGTGFSSLAQLRHFPVDTLKIDRSFVQDIDVDQGSADMVRSIIQMAHNLGISTLAEGVETARQLQLLQQLECEAIQGYLWGRPLDCASAEELLTSQSPAVVLP
ncbi:MAG: EAL domain-containing protein [Pseudomonadaceae bacterium]